MKSILVKNPNLIHLVVMLLSLFLLMSILPKTATAGFFDTKPAGFGSASSDGFLPVERAFRLEGQLKGTKLTLTWDIEPGHYLYRARFQVKSLEPESAQLKMLNIPNGEKVDDEFQGRVEILRNKAELSYQFDTAPEELKQGVVVEVVFQGCAEAGLCYPPHRQRLNLIQK